MEIAKGYDQLYLDYGEVPNLPLIEWRLKIGCGHNESNSHMGFEIGEG